MKMNTYTLKGDLQDDEEKVEYDPLKDSLEDPNSPI